MQVTGPEGYKLARKIFLAVSVACMAIYWPTQGFKGRTFKLCVLNRGDFNFCVRSSPQRGRIISNSSSGGSSSRNSSFSCVFLIETVSLQQQDLLSSSSSPPSHHHHHHHHHHQYYCFQFQKTGELSEAESHKVLDRFVEWGGNFIDTANMYGCGMSEKIVGSWLSG